MPRLASRRQCPRPGTLSPGERGTRLSRAGHLANPSSLITIPRLEPAHLGGKLSFGSSALTALALSLVEIDLADESDWVATGRVPAALVEYVIRRLLNERGQPTIAEHFELSLTLGESIVDSMYSDSGADPNGHLFFVLNTESSFPIGVGEAIADLEAVHSGMGAAFYDTLRQGLCRWIRVYDDWDAHERIEQMKEWAEGENDPDSYEIPNLTQDLPTCLKDRKRSEAEAPLESFPMLGDSLLKELVETTIELRRISHSRERPKVDENYLERERECHSLDTPLPAIMLYFHAGDAVTACFDNECEYWGQEAPEPNLIVPLRPEDPSSVRQALAVVETLMRVLVLTVRISQIIEVREKSTCDSASTSVANSN
jgi:hypothetical protein